VAEVPVVHLGVGLPPSHLAIQKERTIKYYRDFFGDGVKFTYNGMDYSFTLGSLGVYPQNFAVVCAAKREPDSIMENYDDYYTLDFGGYTLDKISIVNNRLNIQECDSIEDGIVPLCEKVIAQVRKDKGVSLDETAVVNILKGKRTVVAPDIVEFVKDFAHNWTHEVLNRLSQSGVNFETRPVVFMGGTTMLLMDYIKDYKKLGCYEVIENPNANADAYKKLIRNQVQSGKQVM
jgi:plasmid segregation protein ParM